MLLPGPSDHSLDTTTRPRRAFLLTLAFLRTKTNGRMTFKRLSIGIKNTMNTSRRRDQSGPAMKRLRDSLQTKISKIIFLWIITIEKHFVFIVTLPIVVEEPTKEALQVCIGLYRERESLGFRAPEVLLKVVEQTPAIDLWSCGIVFLSLLTRRYPFILRHNGHTNDHDLIQICSLCSWEKLKEVSEQLRKEILTNPSSQPIDVFPFIQDAYKETEEEELRVAHDLLFRLLDVNMYTRISAEAALNHPFFQSIN